MRKLLTGALLVAFIALPALARDPGIQVVDCIEDPPGIWTYFFFACTGEFYANGLEIGLTGPEWDEPTVVLGCSVPDLPGYSCASDATMAHYFFPSAGNYTCVPGVVGQYFDIVLSTADGVTIVYETWTLYGVPEDSFFSVIACPPMGTESSTWGHLKTLFR
ncbi:MAG: hypothetical protein ABIH26_11595 [Candidatus Eisenbacteria bacterium]